MTNSQAHDRGAADADDHLWILADDPEDDGPTWPEDPGAGDLTFRS